MAYRAFTTLVADNQYSALGLMLLATLARIRKLIQPLMGDMPDEYKETEKLEHNIETVQKGDLDLGEIVARNSAMDDEDAQAGSELK